MRNYSVRLVGCKGSSVVWFETEKAGNNGLGVLFLPRASFLLCFLRFQFFRVLLADPVAVVRCSAQLASSDYERTMVRYERTYCM